MQRALLRAAGVLARCYTNAHYLLISYKVTTPGVPLQGLRQQLEIMNGERANMCARHIAELDDILRWC